MTALSPVFEPLKFVPVTVPVEATLLGVIAPRVSVIAGVVEAVATVPLTPLAVITDALVTVPVPVPLLLKVFQSVLVNKPVVVVLAVFCADLARASVY